LQVAGGTRHLAGSASPSTLLSGRFPRWTRWQEYPVENHVHHSLPLLFRHPAGGGLGCVKQQQHRWKNQCGAGHYGPDNRCSYLCLSLWSTIGRSYDHSVRIIHMRFILHYCALLFYVLCTSFYNRPLALFIKTIYAISDDFKVDFLAFYAMIGMFNTFFLTLYSFFNMSKLMK